MRVRLASFAVGLTIAAIVGAVAWSSGALGYADDARAFNLTGVGSLGRWTLEPVGANYAWKQFAPATLFVATGEEVVVHLRSADVFHRFYLPAFSVGPIDVEPGHTVTVRFTASRKGVFQFFCTSMCGACHFQMRGWVVVSDPGDTPPVPPALVRGRCPPEVMVPAGATLVERGAVLYEQKGCATCHGPSGRGGVANLNSTGGSVPPHDTTAQKLLLRSREDADAFIGLLEGAGDPGGGAEADITAFPAVRTRFMNAKEIVRHGRYTAGADPHGPEPPLQMPAWEYLLDERDIDALLAYFVSLHEWNEEEPGGSR